MLNDRNTEFQRVGETHAARRATSSFDNRFLTETQAADFLCQSVRTLQKWRVTGFGPKFHKFGRSVRYLQSDILEWVQERTRKNTSQTS